MILPAQRIRERCQGSGAKRLIVPFSERAVVRGMSFGLSSASYDIRIAQDVNVWPGAFVLASTLEEFNIPNDLVAIVHDKSSWARKGLAVQNTLFDPGWKGFATLELSNHGKYHLYIEAGDPIAQVVFHLLQSPTEQPYQGKYQNQEAGPQEAREERNIQEAPNGN